MPRQNDSQRAAREYMKAHPGTTYRQALAIVTGKTPQPAPVTPQGVVLDGYAEGWSNADLNALIATVGELVREGALEPHTDILSSRQIEVAQKAHDVWIAAQDFEQDDDVDDNPFTGRFCEVDDCDRDARGCFCGAAHCDVHPHISDDDAVDDSNDAYHCFECGRDFEYPFPDACFDCALLASQGQTCADCGQAWPEHTDECRHLNCTSTEVEQHGCSYPFDDVETGCNCVRCRADKALNYRSCVVCGNRHHVEDLNDEDVCSSCEQIA